MTTNYKERAAHFKLKSEDLQRAVNALRRELKDVRAAAFAAGSAVTLRDVYRALGDDLAVELSGLMGSRSASNLDPAIEEMVSQGVADLRERAGIKVMS
jgi:hypothetical protein